MFRKQAVAPPARTRQIVGLDLLRGLAAVLVVLFHLGYYTWLEPGIPRAPILNSIPTTSLFAEGWVGVEIFFTLSGFVIAYSTEGATPGRFARHRLQRLLPAALICASVTGLIRLCNHQPAPSVVLSWLRSITLWPVGPWVDGSYWTLPVELSFYALVLIALSVHRGRYLSSMMGTVGVLSTASCWLLLTHPAWVSPAVLAFLNRCWFPPSACLLFVYGVFFALGVLLFSALQHGARGMHWLLIPTCFVGCAMEVCWHEKGSALNAHRPVHMGYAVAIWLLAMGMLVVSVQHNQWIKERLGTRGVALSRQIGLTTYPLYLIHSDIGQWLIRGLNHHIGYAVSLTMVSLSMVAVAAVIAVQVEPRLRRLLSFEVRRVSRGAALQEL